MRWDHAERLDDFLEGFLRDDCAPGVAVGVVCDEELVYARGFGVMSVDGAAPVTPDALFLMSSITKPFTATAVMQLVAQGKARLDAPVLQYLPYFRLRDRGHESITLFHLLTHTPGLPEVEDFGRAANEDDPHALERAVRELAAVSVRHPPGREFTYSSLGFDVLGDVVAKLSVQPFEDYVADHVLERLAMKSSTLIPGRAARAQIATGHSPDDKDLGPEHFTRRDKKRAARRLQRRLEDLGFAVEIRPTTAQVSIWRSHAAVGRAVVLTRC